MGIIPASIIIMSIISPFQFGNLVLGEKFVNREIELKRLKNNFQSNINTVLLSPRRIGKSSLIKQASLKYENKKMRFVFIDFFRIRTEEEFFKIYLQEVLKATLSKSEEFLKAGKDFFRKIIPNFTYSIDPQVDLTISLNWDEAIKAKDEIINLPEKIAFKKGIKIIICIDEFQNISKLEKYKQLEEELRSYWQLFQHTSFCLYGSKKHMMLDIFNTESRSFYRFGDIIILERISTDHWIKYIIESFEKTEKSITETTAKEITDIAKNHPYYVQQLCHHIWNLTASNVNEAIITDSINMVLSTNSIFYQETFENLSNTQINLLKAILAGENQFTSVKTMKKFNLGTPRNVTKNKSILKNKDIIDFQGAQSIFNDPFFEFWIKNIYQNH